MTQDEREFLIAEYEQAWTMILNIDERRFKFVEYFAAIFTGILAISASLVTWHDDLDVAVAVPVTTLLAVGVFVGFTFRWMLKSERAANVRYRKKINLIRGVLLTSVDDPGIEDYLSHKELGILTAADPQPGGTGSTLVGVFRFLNVEICVMALAIPALWMVVILT